MGISITVASKDFLMDENDLDYKSGYDALGDYSLYRDSKLRIEPNDEQSAVRITHKPTGVSVLVMHYRNQAMNKKMALAGLAAMVEYAEHKTEQNKALTRITRLSEESGEYR